jgi:hypothetical protein
MHHPKFARPPPPPPQKSRPYGFKNLYTSKIPATVTNPLTKSIDFRQNYVCDCHLWEPNPDTVKWASFWQIPPDPDTDGQWTST